MSRNKDPLPEDYEALLKLFLSSQEELENKNQELYDSKRQLKAASALEKEYQEEIRTLQVEENERYTKLELKLQQQVETVTAVKTSYSERICSLEKEVIAKDDEISDLTNKLNELAKMCEPKTSSDESDLLMWEVLNLKEKNQLMIEKLEQLQIAYGELEQRNVNLEETITELTTELSNLKEAFNSKREELQEANDLIRTLQDDFLCAKSELDSIKCKPLDDASKGNSLFAEVNDRRLQLQESVNIMRKQFDEMRRERALHLKQIRQLHSENTAICSSWKTDIEAKQYDEDMELEAYKAQIINLNDVIASYRKELENAQSTMPCELKVFETILKTKSQENESLREKILARSVNETLLTQHLAQARRETRAWKLEVAELKSELGLLKVQLEEMQLKAQTKENQHPTKETENSEEKHRITENKTLKSIIRKTDIVPTVDDTHIKSSDKENDCTVFIDNSVLGPSRKVQFTSDAKDLPPQHSGNISKRRGTKIHVCKPIHITSHNNNNNSSNNTNN